MNWKKIKHHSALALGIPPKSDKLLLKREPSPNLKVGVFPRLSLVPTLLLFAISLSELPVAIAALRLNIYDSGQEKKAAGVETTMNKEEVINFYIHRCKESIVFPSDLEIQNYKSSFWKRANQTIKYKQIV